MGQKVHPYGFRLGYNKDWHSHWFAKRQFGEFLLEDLKLKRDLKQRFAGAGVSHVDIERAANRLKTIIYTSRPGIIIGRKGAEIDKLKSDLSSKTGREGQGQEEREGRRRGFTEAGRREEGRGLYGRGEEDRVQARFEETGSGSGRRSKGGRVRVSGIEA